MNHSFSKIYSVFNDTTNSYKYYWWYSILILYQEKRTSKLTLEDIAIRIIICTWYPINFYKISLGPQDQLGRYVKLIQNKYGLPDDINEDNLRKFLEKQIFDPSIVKIINGIIRYVPYRFLRIWMPHLSNLPDGQINKLILRDQLKLADLPPYFINEAERRIEIYPHWIDWLDPNLPLIKDFTLYHLYKYVEKNNPDISNLSNKLFRPSIRNLRRPTLIWKAFVDEKPHRKSVFENCSLSLLRSFTLDHYIPWSFVTHDQLWNLHPVETTTNSSKGNKLPADRYLNTFIDLQYDLLKFLIKSNQKEFTDYSKFLQLSRAELNQIEKVYFFQIFFKQASIKIDTASKAGFQIGWEFNYLK